MAILVSVAAFAGAEAPSAISPARRPRIAVMAVARRLRPRASSAIKSLGPPRPPPADHANAAVILFLIAPADPVLLAPIAPVVPDDDLILNIQPPQGRRLHLRKRFRSISVGEYVAAHNLSQEHPFVSVVSVAGTFGMAVSAKFAARSPWPNLRGLSRPGRLT
jgi:hypothetical protein